MYHLCIHIGKELQVTTDGSHTLYIPAIGEHYHSVNGALQESRHISIEAGLHAFEKDFIRIVETGFGTRLSAFLTLGDVELSRTHHIDYHTVGLYPLPLGTIHALNYRKPIWPEKRELFLILHEAEWDTPVSIPECFTPHKIEGDSNACELPDGIDLIYFNTFAPEKQPETWNQEIYNRLYTHTTPSGVIVTYCTRGEVRRDMQAADFGISHFPGSPGKRRIPRGIKS